MGMDSPLRLSSTTGLRDIARALSSAVDLDTTLDLIVRKTTDVGGGEMEFVPAELDENNRIHSQLLPGFWLDIEWLLAAESPDPAMCVADVLRGHEGVMPEHGAMYKTMYQMYVGL